MKKLLIVLMFVCPPIQAEDYREEIMDNMVNPCFRFLAEGMSKRSGQSVDYEFLRMTAGADDQITYFVNVLTEEVEGKKESKRMGVYDSWRLKCFNDMRQILHEYDLRQK